MVAVGDDGYILLSDDGGDTWETNTITNTVTTDRNQDAADLLLKTRNYLLHKVYLIT